MSSRSISSAFVLASISSQASTLDELIVIAPEGDSDDAAELAEAVGARWTTVDGPSSIVGALAQVLDR